MALKIKIPKRINVLGKIISIRFDDRLDNQGLAGFYEPATSRIYLNPNAPDIEQTYVHELIHCVCHRAGINQVISRHAEEIVAENIATVVCEVLLKIKR